MNIIRRICWDRELKRFVYQSLLALQLKKQPYTSPNVIATVANLSAAKIGEAEQSLPNKKA